MEVQHCYGVCAMGQSYSQLDLKERGQIEVLLSEGYSLRAIAACLQRSPPTISREVWRNGQRRAKRKGVYVSERADLHARSRRRLDHRFKLARQPARLKHVVDRLAMGWSPQQISGRLALERGSPVISHESIYRYVYYRSAQKDWLHRLLPCRKFRRGRIRRGGVSALDKIRDRVSIHERCDAATGRHDPGHWEADLMMFGRHGQALLVMHERTSRFTFLKVMKGKHAAPVATALARMMSPLPDKIRQSVAFDNGPEFFLHHKLKEKFGMQGYFCDPRAPWQKGGVESLIGRLRRHLPRKTNILTVPEARIRRLQKQINTTPRRCLDYKTPDEVFSSLLKSVALQT